jgi:lipopolysaccharide transport system ATP-binding protein
MSTTSERTWVDADAPGNGVARLRNVRVRDTAGGTVDSVDIRSSFGVEMVFDVLEAGHVLTPAMAFHDESGNCVFLTQNLDPSWRGSPQPRGTVTTVAWIPGNMLAEGLLLVTVTVGTPHPLKVHFHQRDVVALHVVDSFEGDSARGDWDGPFPGIVRPLLSWTTQLAPPSVNP